MRFQKPLAQTRLRGNPLLRKCMNAHPTDYGSYESFYGNWIPAIYTV